MNMEAHQTKEEDFFVRPEGGLWVDHILGGLGGTLGRDRGSRAQLLDELLRL